MSGGRSSSEGNQDGDSHQDSSDPRSPTMEEFEMEDEDGPLLSQLESGHRKEIRSCPLNDLMFRSSIRSRSLLIVAALSFIVVSFIVVGILLFAGNPLKSRLHNESPFVQIPKSNSTTDFPLRHGNSTLLEMGHSYVKAIVTPEDTLFPRLECPSPSFDRYDYLQDSLDPKPKINKPPSYFFALDLHQCVMSFPENCALSVVEGRSENETFEVLKLLQDEVEAIGIKYFFTSNEIDPGKDNSVHRISALAELRNIALLPLVEHAEAYNPNVTVVFINDVAICMEDILEFVHQRQYQKADMTCAMDWTFVGHDPTFYDVWIARGMNGDSFFDIPPDGSWNSAWNLFWNNPTAQQRQRAGQPFQVFSCWNGAVTFTARPLIEGKLRFRGPRRHECFQGEPKIFAKEMWYHGYGKIAVIPSVNLEYNDEAATKIKAQKGYVSKWIKNEEPNQGLRSEWDSTPPEKVKCIPSYDNQTWPPWDEAL